MARPSEYTQEKADLICEQLANGISLRTVCEGDGMPSGATVFKWMRDYPEFLKQYARAKEESADALIEQMQDDAADDSKDIVSGQFNSVAVQRSRLKVDTNKWIASKLKPKKYGEKLELAGDQENPIRLDVATMLSKVYGSATTSGPASSSIVHGNGSDSGRTNGSGGEIS